MEGMWTLVLFTLLTQGALGMVILQAFFGGKKAIENHTWSKIALAIFAIGVVCSMGHLSDPFVSYYTISNVGTSWLSREIVGVSLCGILLLGFVLTRSRTLLIINALVSLALIYIMAQAYAIPRMVFWNSGITFGIFLSTSILLGATTLLAGNMCRSKKAEVPSLHTAQAMLCWQVPVLFIAFVVRTVLTPLQVNLAEHDIKVSWLDSQVLFTGLAAFFVICLLRTALRGQMEDKEIHKRMRCYSTCMILFMWFGELCGRVLFYQGYVWFGM